MRRLGEEQSALRRVATLVARGEPPEAMFAAVLEEVGRLLPINLALIGLRDRIEALGGTLDVTSSADGGTTLLIEIPA